MKLVVALIAGFLVASSVEASIGSTAIGRAVGNVVNRVVAKKVAGEVVGLGVKTASKRAMSSALRGVTVKHFASPAWTTLAKRPVATGLGGGLLVSVPIASHEVADGVQEEFKSHADAIRTTATSVAEVSGAHPDIAGQTLSEYVRELSNGSSASGFRNMLALCGKVGPWAIGGSILLVVIFYLFGWIIRSYKFARHEMLQKEIVPIAQKVKRDDAQGTDSSIEV